MNDAKALACWVVGQGAVELREERLPALEAGQVRVRTLYTAVSRGTESLVFHGRVPESEYFRMRCPHQVGDFPWPVKYGYSNVGRVVAGSGKLSGERVFCLFPHQTQYQVSEDAVLPIPDEVSDQRALLAANLETAVNALWDARPLVGDRISVIGAGAVGCLCAYVASRLLATDVQLVDINPARAEIAEKLGVRFADPDSADPERDLVIHATATEAGLKKALTLCADGAEILELSWYGDQSVSLELGADFHARRLCLRSSQVGTVSPNARARFTHRRRLGLALRLCADPQLDALFDGESEFDNLPETMPKLFSPQPRALCHRIKYNA